MKQCVTADGQTNRQTDRCDPLMFTIDFIHFQGVISAVAFIVATILLSQMFALEPPLLEYDLGPALTFVLTNKIGGGIVVAVIYISSIARYKL